MVFKVTCVCTCLIQLRFWHSRRYLFNSGFGFGVWIVSSLGWVKSTRSHRDGLSQHAALMIWEKAEFIWLSPPPSLFEGITLKEESVDHVRNELSPTSIWASFAESRCLQHCTPVAATLTWAHPVVTQFFHLSWMWLWIFVVEHLQVDCYQYTNFYVKRDMSEISS